MNEYMPDIMKTVAHDRIVNAKNVGADVIVTESPSEYKMLAADGSIEVRTFEEVVLECLQA